MTCKEIYDASLSLIAESRDPADSADYAERAPYLLAAFCCELYDTDARLREYLYSQKSESAPSLYLPLDGDFPLLDRFAASAVLYLGAMLVIDDFPELSDRLYDRYCDSVSRLCDRLSAKCEKTANRYFVN